MKKKNIGKRMLSAVLILVMLLALAACTGGQQTTAAGAQQSTAATTAAEAKPSTAAGAQQSSAATTAAAASTASVLTGDRKLSILTVPASAPFPDGQSIMKCEFFDLIQEKTGYTLEWQLLKAGESADDQINLIMAANDVPDMIQGAGSSLIMQYAKDGGLASLDEALPIYAPYLNEYYGADVIKANSIDGKLYYMPRLARFSGVTGLAVRKDILTELNLSAPTTPDEIYNTLKAVKESKPDMIPYVISSGIAASMTDIMGAFGLQSDRSYNFLIEDGKVVFPYTEERGAEFIKYAAKLYADGLVDPEFLIDKETTEKMIAGNGFMMQMDYVTITRKMSAFLEKNPKGVLEYIDPPKGENNEQGILGNFGIGAPFFIVPAKNADKVPYVLDFLDKVNSNEDVLDIFALGVVGRDTIKNADGTITKTDNFANVSGPKGYYSRLDLTDHFDTVNGILEGFDKPLAFIAKTAHDNDIKMAPMGVPASADKISNLNTVINDDITNMVIDGFTDAAFEKMKKDFADAGGAEILSQYQEWYDQNH